MKALLFLLLFTSYCGKTAKAEIPAEEATRKVGDKACEMINGKLECATESEKRQAAAVVRKEQRARENAKLDLKEQACREINGKLECAGKKAKEKIEHAVE